MRLEVRAPPEAGVYLTRELRFADLLELPP
jgi:hypothetical protein